MDGELLAAADQLAALPAPTSGRFVAIDTEFVRERTYFAQLGLVQVEIDGRIALIDPVPSGMPDAIAALLQRCPQVAMHAAGEDLEALKVACGQLPITLFDTQIAAGLAGFGAGLSLQKLIEATVGVTLAKSETRTDWMRRPLSDAQLDYAADDVRHLVAAADVLLARLRELGREAWVAEDCARMLAAAADDAVQANPHLAFKPAQRFPRDAQIRARRLLLWRDAEARQSDRPRGWILDNGLTARLAERPPSDRQQFERLLDATPGSPRKNRESLWDVLSRETTGEERDLPLAIAPDGADRTRLKRLQSAVTAVATELQVPESVLASRRHLEGLLVDRRWPDALSGWRRPLLEPILAPALD